MTRSKAITWFTVLIACVFIASVHCGTVASVRPMGKDRSSLTFCSGGPVAPVFDIQMPIPYSVLRYRRGLNENTDFHCGIHPTMMVLGNVALEVGITKLIVDQGGWRPALALEGSAYLFMHVFDISTTRAYPEIGIVASYNLSLRGHLIYFGFQNIIQYDEPYWISAPLIGVELPLGRFNINLEAKWYAPQERSDNRIVDYTLIPADKGAIGFVWGLSYRL
ncbi:MAG: hypothetical protein JSW02_09865 [candidate division WOR-3 bacterium]|nr:MAG: hypothetical protein JSW02_09865 [candidate division WOR-3 bacterium]